VVPDWLVISPWLCLASGKYQGIVRVDCSAAIYVHQSPHLI